MKRQYPCSQNRFPHRKIQAAQNGSQKKNEGKNSAEYYPEPGTLHPGTICLDLLK